MNDSKSVRLSCLREIESISFILNITTRYQFGKDAAAVRMGVNEPLTPRLEDFVTNQVVPEVLKLTTMQDPQISSFALSIAAVLQDVTIIPELVKMVQTGNSVFSSTAIYVIGNYRNPNAVKQLVPLLKSSGAGIRERSAYALGMINNSTAIPFLLDDVEDSNADARHSVINALFEITNEIPPPSSKQYPEREPEYIAFWHDWETKNKEKVDKLRTQFNAVLEQSQ